MKSHQVLQLLLTSVLLACGGAAGLSAEPTAGHGIGLAKYKLVTGPITIRGVRDNASGLTFSPVTNSLFLAVNSPASIVELGLDGVVRRVIALKGFDDSEAVTHVKDQTFAVVEERRYTLCLIRIDRDTKAVDYGTAVKVTLESKTGDNVGLEGVAFDAAGGRFFCVKEMRPMRVYEVPMLADRRTPGRPKYPWAVENNADWNLTDLSGLHFDARSGHLLVVSHESRAIVECTPQGEPIAQLSLTKGNAGLAASIPQAEGITMDSQGRLYICSEPNLFYVFAK